jgi:outer membrane protein assembly factor BamB
MRGWSGFAGAVLLTALVACSADKPKPTPLAAITPQIAGRLVWSAHVEGAPPGLIVSARDGEFTVAAADGTVMALQADSGREIWRGSAGARLTAGVGSDGRYAAVATRDNEVVVLERGVVKWRARIASRVSTPPLVAGERVFVMGVDRVVNAYDAIDGRFLWKLQRQGEPLTLSQPGVVAAFKDTLLVGQGQRLTGVDPLRGTVRWEVAVGNPRGTNEVERLSDLIGPALRVGDRVCARSFQSAVGCVDAQLATLMWSKNVGGLQAIGGDAELVVGADASDRITAWRGSNGDLAWNNESLRYRGLSGPLVVGRTVIFGDADGQVHFLDRADGKTLLRMPTDGSPVVGAPVRSGTTILVVTRKGGLFAFRPE